ncbi:MAG: mannonate dehydratase [Ignavibacteriaceae bacterium]
MVRRILLLDEIDKRKTLIESEGLAWSVAESIPVHEDIKKQKGKFQKYLDNYKVSINNLSKSGVDTVCYNFMPVLDWSRTNLRVIFKDGAITTQFESKVFAAFDLFMLQRKNAEKDYSTKKIEDAKKYYEKMSNGEKDELKQTILYGLPGSLEAYTLDEFRSALTEYNEIGDKELRDNLYYFIKEIIPVAEEAGVLMGIHPDDPPWSLLGLPRIVGTKQDIQQIINVVDSPSNGITFCTGSFGAGYKNDLVDMAKTFSNRINFLHLRNLTRNANGDFTEAYHLDGDIDLYGVIKTLLLEQQKRINEGRKDSRMPMRPDHGHLMIPEQSKQGIYPGYSLFGRMRGLAELRGMELGILRSLGI